MKEKITDKQIKEYFLENNYELLNQTHKSYGSYYTFKRKYEKMKTVEISISNIKRIKNTFVVIRETHYRGNINGYISTIKELSPIITFITNESTLLL